MVYMAAVSRFALASAVGAATPRRNRLQSKPARFQQRPSSREVRSTSSDQLTPRRRLVRRIDRRAEGDELEPIGACDRKARRGGVDADEAPGLQLDLVARDAHRAGAADDEVDLLLVRLLVAVLAAGLVRGQDEVVEAECARADGAARLAHHPAGTLALEAADIDEGVAAHIRKMPNVVSGIGAFSAAEIPSASTRRVSSGSMMPSSQSRAVE